LRQIGFVYAEEILRDVPVVHGDSPSLDGGAIVHGHADSTLTRA